MTVIKAVFTTSYWKTVYIWRVSTACSHKKWAEMHNVGCLHPDCTKLINSILLSSFKLLRLRVIVLKYLKNSRNNTELLHLNSSATSQTFMWFFSELISILSFTRPPLTQFEGRPRTMKICSIQSVLHHYRSPPRCADYSHCVQWCTPTQPLNCQTTEQFSHRLHFKWAHVFLYIAHFSELLWMLRWTRTSEVCFPPQTPIHF